MNVTYCHNALDAAEFGLGMQKWRQAGNKK
jgi:hypothetical protein